MSQEITIDLTNDIDDAYSFGTTHRTDRTFLALASSSAIPISGLRFPNVVIPFGATILHAYINLFVVGSSGVPNLYIAGEASVDPVAPESGGVLFSREKTVAQVDWDPPAVLNTYTGNSPDIKDIIQEIIDLEGWESGKDILILVGAYAYTSTYQIEDAQSGAGHYAKLIIEYDEPEPELDLSSYPASKKVRTGYHAFLNQALKNQRAGLPVLNTPDGEQF